jgi:hypothetical protein
MEFESFVDGVSGVADERNFARSLRADYGGWSDQYHPGLGASAGQPDMQFLASGVRGDLRIVPIELKTAVWDGQTLKVSNIRPNQIRWAKKFRTAGGKSGFLAGVPLVGSDPKELVWGAVLLDLDLVFKGVHYFEADEFKTVSNFTDLFAEVLG